MYLLSPQIYIACLAAYNNGKLHGVWIDATQDVDHIWEEINAIAKFIEEYGPLGGEVLAYYSNGIDDAQKVLNECYHGEYDSELDYASELFDELYGNEMPDYLASYINYDRFARDLFISDYYSLSINGKVHVFSHC